MKKVYGSVSRLTRRNFIKTSTAFLTAVLARSNSLLASPRDLSSATHVTDVSFDLDHLVKWDDSNGDTWDPFWADDDNLYAFNCDGRGFGTQGRNLAFNKFEGTSADRLKGTLVNSMDEYGAGGKQGSDNATWKACGQECIDGVFYAFVSRNVYGKDSNDPLLRQTAANSSLIKSTDRGLTWTRTAAENYDRPMWPGSRFGAPFFVHYGRNGGQVPQDNGTAYVYAISTNGFWNDGDFFILGRVRRKKLPNLKAEDWEYYLEGDGARSQSWTLRIEDAGKLLSAPAECGQSPMCYIPSLRIYLLISWYSTGAMTKWFEPNQMRYSFYQAEHPWGPWSPVSSPTDDFIGGKGHMYGPSLCAKFQRLEGADLHMPLFTSGCPFEDRPTGLYKAWQIPIVLKTLPLPRSYMVDYADPRIQYEGDWFLSNVIDWPKPPSDAQMSRSAGDSAQIAFEGVGIEYLGQKDKEQGAAKIYLDGTLQETVSLRMDDFPRLSGVVLFSKRDLARARHVLRVVSESETPVTLQSFRVYS